MDAQSAKLQRDPSSQAVHGVEAGLDTLDALVRENTSKVADGATVEQLAQQIPQPTWAELLSSVIAKLKHTLAEHRANAKAYAGSLTVLTIIGLCPWPHQVTCEVVCEPVVRRYISAPFDATLLQSRAKTGQRVQAGQVLASLDGGDLRGELAAKRAVHAQAAQRQRAALASGDHSKSENERLEVEYLQREIELLESRQSRLEVRSPIDGVVISGDLERVAGASLEVGDSLFEIASLDRLIAEVAVPESDVSFVESGMQVNVALDAAPGLAQKSEVSSIHLRSEIRNNASVFIAEVELDNQDELFRPGMHGTANVHTGYRPLAWVLFHRPYEAMRHWIGW